MARGLRCDGPQVLRAALRTVQGRFAAQFLYSGLSRSGLMQVVGASSSSTLGSYARHPRSRVCAGAPSVAPELRPLFG
eukprot:CAMPEP_0203859052 /NCGR_PEP_ID=MMETSP0359-20131031/11616_1 /ASSEMBLY_ACC=CAM_ASM_000338 /TAXON_ID=268821 /ORGANISM="Scrippsiella Hangoei, Strain SHTV-5" /LENGTH=77 /DNA_ID=CAMNT_0050775887 /DNA_START=83 /DNA_END=317 /DNA_ORIENTATION=-